MRASREWMRVSREWMRVSREWMRASREWMRASLVVDERWPRVDESQPSGYGVWLHCQSRNSPALQIILELCIPEKYLAKTNSFPNFIYIFPKSFIIFSQELQDPKGILKPRFEPRLPRMSS
jgi:hypothetical protein